LGAEGELEFKPRVGVLEWAGERLAELAESVAHSTPPERYS
jgi:hypothetical protein